MYLLEYENENGKRIEFSFESGIIISTITGLTSNNVALSESQGVNQIGTTVQNRSIESKPIAITGRLLGNSTYNKRQLLNTILPGVKGSLIYNKKWRIQVETVQSPDITSETRNPYYQFILKAPFPYWEAVTPTISPMSGETAEFEFWDLTQDVYFGQRFLNERTTVKNNGNVDALFNVVFFANRQVENPTIINAITNEYFRIKETMSIGDSIVVNILRDGINILKNDGEITTNIDGSLDIYSELSRIRPGENIFKIEADSGIENLDATIIHNDTTAGVFNENTRIR